MTMWTIEGDFTHLREIAHMRARDTALQHKMQPISDAAPQRRRIIASLRKNINKISHIQLIEFNIIDIMSAFHVKSVPQRRKTPPLNLSGRGKKQMPSPRIPEKKFSTPPRHEVLT